MTIREALRSAAERLELHHVSNPRLTAELLLANCLSVDREYLYTHDEHVLGDTESQGLEDVLCDRINGVPLQYIVGRQEFYGRYFRVTPAVLIPRPETEHIVEAVLELHKTAPQTARPRILDVGTGSGCIAVTLALELAGARIFASDISEAALRVGRANASSLGASVGFLCMDVLDAVAGQFEFIVSNPPYVKLGDISRLQREVREYEPHVALFSPEDELQVYRRLITGAERLLEAGGHLLMEVGIGMDERVLGLFGAGWRKLPTKTDLQGIPRTVIAQKSAA
ncbi:MAG TPA: peptide chain release factor N(5)-glutamine methyltransferase [Terriglobia bacterium]|nr:peptide chain release factor N(5)-glutamine methyltransferase [Terriglobia bacterium]